MSSTPDDSTHQPPAPLPDPGKLLTAAVELAWQADRSANVRSFAEWLARAAAQLTQADQASVGLVSGDEVATLAALPPPQAPVGSRFPLGSGAAGWVAATGRAAVIGDVRSDARYVEVAYPEVRSFVALPLATEGRVVGILSLASWHPNAFSPRIDEVLAPFTAQAAIALRHKLADDELRARVDELEAAVHVGGAELAGKLHAPLEAVLGLIQLATSDRAGRLGEERRELLDVARRECERLLDEIERATNPSRGGERGAPEPASIARNAIELAQVDASRRQVQLALEVDESARPVEADAGSTEQVLATLLRQAVGRSARGSAVTLAVAGVDRWTCFMVADRGESIPAEEMQRVFGQNGAATPTANGEDVGHSILELWLARQIVERQAGVMWAEPRDGGGTRVCFAFRGA